mgnify:CR=1 FL=1
MDNNVADFIKKQGEPEITKPTDAKDKECMDSYSKIQLSSLYGEMHTMKLSEEDTHAIKIPKNEFQKVSLEQFKKDVKNTVAARLGFTDKDYEDGGKVEEIYNNIQIPRRSTQLSAGYDFYCPFDISVDYSQCIIPTGIKIQLVDYCYLALYPRSSYGIKYGIGLCNTVGIIDADYYNNTANEGHIMVALARGHNMADTVANVFIKQGDKFVQGIINMYAKTIDDCPVSKLRTGGIGSTGK